MRRLLHVFAVLLFFIQGAETTWAYATNTHQPHSLYFYDADFAPSETLNGRNSAIGLFAQDDPINYVDPDGRFGKQAHAHQNELNAAVQVDVIADIPIF
ncbi:MAG: hypothetical protein AAF551_08350 [Bacteroidota bacterium]